MAGESHNTKPVDQKSEHQSILFGKSHSENLDWNDLRFFLAVADAGSFRGAAQDLGSSINAVRKRIDDLEYELNCILFARSPSGTSLTTDGRSVYSVAVEIRDRVGLLDTIGGMKGVSGEGIVRLAMTEGLGTFWIMPKLSELSTLHPKIKVDLRCEMKIPDISRLECDLAVQLEKPRDESLVIRKIATLHLLLYASDDYIRLHGTPKSVSDHEDHSFVHLVADQIPSHLLAEKVKTDPQFRFVRILTNSSSAQVMAIAESAGIGVLPSYATVLSPRLVPINANFYLKRPVWLVYHPGVIKLRRVRVVADWIIEAFDPKKYPWFRDEYIPPEDFAAEAADIQLFHRALDWRSPAE